MKNGVWNIRSTVPIALLVMGGMAGILYFYPAIAQAAKAPAAMITNLSGEVFIQREGASPKTRGELASFLFAGDKLELGGNGNLTLVYFQGCSQEVLKGPGGALILADKTKDLGKMLISSVPLKKCGPSPNVDITPESSLAKGVMTLRGQSMITRLSPSETKVLAVNPTFSWHSPEAKKVIVTLYDKNLNKLWDTQAQGQEITYPAGAPSLQRGEMYRWSVNNDVNAYFVVAMEEEVKALEGKQKAFEPAVGSPSQDLTYLLLSGMTYAEAGFNLEAADYYRKVLQIAPPSRQVRLWLAQIYDQMGWRAEAQKELEEAKKLGKGE